MWKRALQVFRSVIGGAVAEAENPELILKQAIRDMEDELPHMQALTASIMGEESRAKASLDEVNASMLRVDEAIKRLVAQGKDQEATQRIVELTGLQKQKQSAEQTLEIAKNASAKARADLENYKARIEVKRREASQSIAQLHQAEVNDQTTATLAGFGQQDNFAVLDEMREKILNQKAAAEAKVELGQVGFEGRMLEVETSLNASETENILNQYKLQAGKVDVPVEINPLNLLGEGSPHNDHRQLGPKSS